MGLLDPPVQTCDPAPNAFHTTVLSKANGQVTITIHWGWDGVSVFPNCAGPLLDVRLQNTGADTWYLNLPNGKQLKKRPITPGTDVTITGAQLTAAGITTVADIEGFTLTPV